MIPHRVARDPSSPLLPNGEKECEALASLKAKTNSRLVALPQALDLQKPSHPVHRLVRGRRQLDLDRVARTDVAAGQHDAHDTGFADQLAVRVAPQERGGQAGLETVELLAGIA